jgi:hypothetical protein
MVRWTDRLGPVSTCPSECSFRLAQGCGARDSQARLEFVPRFDECGFLPPGLQSPSLQELAERLGPQSELPRVQVESIGSLHDAARQPGTARSGAKQSAFAGRDCQADRERFHGDRPSTRTNPALARTTDQSVEGRDHPSRGIVGSSRQDGEPSSFTMMGKRRATDPG